MSRLKTERLDTCGNKKKRWSTFSQLLPFCLMVVAWCMTACSDDDTAIAEQAGTQVLKVAVLAEEEEQVRWKRTAQWALENIGKAQQGMNSKVELELEFYNQDAGDIENLMDAIAKDETIAAVLGPTSSKRAAEMALKLNARKSYHKPMITPSATQTEYQRKFADTPFVWNMAESDIAQLEVLIAAIAVQTSGETISLLAADDGNDYAEWFGFIAEEYGLRVDGLYLYETADDVRRYARQQCGTDKRIASKSLVFNPSDINMALAFDDEIGKMKAEAEFSDARTMLYVPTIYCSDAFVHDRIAAACTHASYQGVDLYAMPESGFGPAYRQHFDEDLEDGEAQFYDAICLVAYAATLSNQTGQPLNDAILSVVDGRDGEGSSWLPSDMGNNFQKLAMGVTPDLDGVSGTWTFDEQTHSSVVESTFRHWHLYDGKFVTTEYITTSGSKRTSSSKNIWDWTASNMQTFKPEENDNRTYPELDKRWALLIAASKGWDNYRFQADVFAMYQILKQNGYDDDHIVLVCEDDIAYNSKNAEQGILRVSDDGENLYDASAIDYKLGNLSSSDIDSILQGKRSERLPQVINADEDDNVFVFWSGHGSSSKMLDFGGKSVSYEQIRNCLSATPHRKLLFAIEACYSGGLGKYCEGLPGMLFVTAASPNEPSRASGWSKQLGIYRSNGFTRGFQKAIASNPSISLRDLYYHLAQSTTGSHVKVYNTSFYGSVYKNTMGEFLRPAL